MKAITGLAADLFALAIGWAFCMGMLAGAFTWGRWAAEYLIDGQHADAFGILSALAVIWIYEHRLSQDRWDRLNADQRA